MALKRDKVEELKEEITELKLSDIRKDISTLKDILCGKLNDMQQELTETKEHVKKTNGSVAKVTADNFALQHNFEMHCNANLELIKRAEKSMVKLDIIDKETSGLRWVLKRPRLISAVVIIFLYSMAVPEIRLWLIELIQKII